MSNTKKRTKTEAQEQKETKPTWEARAYEALDRDGRGFVKKNEILDFIFAEGIETQHEMAPIVASLQAKKDDEAVTFEELHHWANHRTFKRVHQNDFTIPRFDQFASQFLHVFQRVKEDPEKKYAWGECADYIPTLAKADPTKFAASFCSSDAQFTQTGDIDILFSIQSISKVVAYAYLYDLFDQRSNGEELHKFVGEEPSGVAFNAPVFDKKGRPHNPYVNAGAIMTSTLLVNEGKNIKDFQEFFIRASSVKKADIDIELYHEEASTGANNHALRSLMLARSCYPKKANWEETKKLADDGLDFYFQQCSMLVNVEGLARFGAMLAANGVNPTSGERIISPRAVQAAVTLMQVCGMYDGAGRYTKHHGVPTKSGVAGGLMTVLPGIGSIASLAPPLDDEGNSVRGVGMIEGLSSIFSNMNLFHKDGNKKDLTRKPYGHEIRTVIAACDAASREDIDTLENLRIEGVDLSMGDYDRRTPLHLAATAGDLPIVKTLVEVAKVDVNPVDRWGATPLNDAQGYPEIAAYLKKHGATQGKDMGPHIDITPSLFTDRDFKLLCAARDNDVLFMQSLRIQGLGSFNNRDYDGRTALGVAASEGRLEAVNYLLAHGGDPTIRDIRGNDALADATREGHPAVADAISAFLSRLPVLS